MPLTREQLDEIATHILKLLFWGTYLDDDYMGSACVAVTSDGTNVYVAANDAYSDNLVKENLRSGVLPIFNVPHKQRPYIWRRNKYRLNLFKKQRFWNQFHIVTSVISFIYKIDPKRILLIPNRLGEHDRSFHAEMQLIRYHEIAEIPLQPRYVGVSKPCCEDCATVLLDLGIGFRLIQYQSRSRDWVRPTDYLEGNQFEFLELDEDID